MGKKVNIESFILFVSLLYAIIGIICFEEEFFLFWECPWTRHFRAQPSAGETQENRNNVSCHPDMTEILLKAA